MTKFWCIAALLGAGFARGADDIEVIPVQPNFYMIAGAGGNIAVQIGPDGVLVVDTGAARMTERVLAEIRKLRSQPIRFIINTSADADHVGRQREVGQSGRGRGDYRDGERAHADECADR